MMQKEVDVKGAKILIMGLTFKENCPDLRNTKVVDIISELRDFHLEVDVYDPWADVKEAEEEYGETLIEQPAVNHYDAVVLTVAHDKFKRLGREGIALYTKPKSIIYDLKYILPFEETDLRL